MCSRRRGLQDLRPNSQMISTYSGRVRSAAWCGADSAEEKRGVVDVGSLLLATGPFAFSTF